MTTPQDRLSALIQARLTGPHLAAILDAGYSERDPFWAKSSVMIADWLAQELCDDVRVEADVDDTDEDGDESRP